MSVDAQQKALIRRWRKLAEFQDEVDYNIAQDFPLAIRDRNGEYPVVVALGSEPLSLLVERLNAEPEGANVFIKDADGHVSYLTYQRTNDSGKSLDMSDEGSWNSGDSQITLFLKLLSNHPEGVLIPLHLPESHHKISLVKNNPMTSWKAPDLV